MPNCFTLTKIGQTEPSTFAEIDNDICQHLDKTPHEKHFLYGWYDSIGPGFAMGLKIKDMRDWWDLDSPMHDIMDYLEINYQVNAWYEHK